MIDDEKGRLDLHAIEPDVATENRVIAAAMSRIRATPQLPADDVGDLAQRAARPVLFAAAVLIAAAGVVLMVDPPGMADQQPDATVASWVEASHVPTNEELLLTFHGYSR
jgi:2,4-dienoyl-CoA reductase-like NADH-dependent reductase (Old Yellow Enzyme family)